MGRGLAQPFCCPLARLARRRQVSDRVVEHGVVQLRVTCTAPDEVAMVDNGSPFFESWCVHESIRWRGSEAAWE
jgi:hypothetical protein